MDQTSMKLHVQSPKDQVSAKDTALGIHEDFLMFLQAHTTVST